MKVTLILALASTAAAKISKSKAFLSSDMQPEVVAHTLVQVEDEWRAQAVSFAECNATLAAGAEAADCSSALQAFEKSCTTVVEAVVKSSSGDRSRVTEYMGVVCGEAELSGWHQGRCTELASALEGAMIDDNYENRENLNTAKLCTGFWSRFTVEEKARIETEQAERAAAEKKADEERAVAEKKAEEERVVAEQKAAALAAEEAKRLAKEDAEKKAEEAKKAAEDAAAAMKAQKEEAERQAEQAKQQAEDAKKKLEEAQAAAEVATQKHQEMVDKQKAAAIANVTVVANKTNVTVPVLAENATNATQVNATKVTAPVVNATKVTVPVVNATKGNASK